MKLKMKTTVIPVLAAAIALSVFARPAAAAEGRRTAFGLGALVGAVVVGSIAARMNAKEREEREYRRMECLTHHSPNVVHAWGRPNGYYGEMRVIEPMGSPYYRDQYGRVRRVKIECRRYESITYYNGSEVERFTEDVCFSKNRGQWLSREELSSLWGYEVMVNYGHHHHQQQQQQQQQHHYHHRHDAPVSSEYRRPRPVPAPAPAPRFHYKYQYEFGWRY